ncbi:hypothetical protein EDB83DRAFT_914968 [Lactarius deliciosus]|nr:hypothetical protein EDB83DRAFT_914968 [Lactarius deliciosus]
MPVLSIGKFFLFRIVSHWCYRATPPPPLPRTRQLVAPRFHARLATCKSSTTAIPPRESPASVPCHRDTQDPPLHQPAAHKPRQNPPIASYSSSPMVSFGLSLMSSVSPPVVPSPPRPYPGGLSFSPHFTSIFGIATNASRRSQPSDRFILLISQYGFIRSLASIFGITSHHSQPSDHFIPLLALSQRPLSQPLPHQRRRHRSLRQSSLVEAHFPQGHSLQTPPTAPENTQASSPPLSSLVGSPTLPHFGGAKTRRSIEAPPCFGLVTHYRLFWTSVLG